MHYNANTARRIFKYLNTKNIPRQGDILNNYKKLKRLGNIKKEGLHCRPPRRLTGANLEVEFSH